MIIVHFISSAVLFTTLASATKLVPETLPESSVATTPALHYDNLFLSQTDAWTDADVNSNECWRTRDRIIKRPIDDNEFYSLINRKDRTRVLESQEDFKHGNQVLYWKDQGEGQSSLAYVSNKITWERAGKVFQDKTLFGERGITVDDVAQGSIGNCWLCAAFASVAENPLAVHKAFLNTKRDLAPTGLYGVNLYVLGHPMTFVVDDYLPLKENSEGQFSTIFSKVAEDGSLWVPILEKVFAKRYGNYQHLIGGDSRDGLAALTGGPSMMLNHDEVDEATLWNMLKNHDTKGDYMQANTAGSNDQQQNAVGLAMGHAFTVLEAKTLSTGVRLVKCRNPWGQEKYHGPWSDESNLWNEKLKREVNLVVNTKDGIFWTDIGTYIQYFASTMINYDSSAWHQSNFLMKNDKTKNPGTVQFCGETCTRHEFTLTSDVDQKVFITAHTWQNRSFSKKCQRKTNDKYPQHFIQVGEGTPCLVFKEGDRRAAPIEMKAGIPININTEWNFADHQNPPDWAVTTQGAEGSLHLRHKKDLKTASWNPIRRSQTKGDSAYWTQ